MNMKYLLIFFVLISIRQATAAFYVQDSVAVSKEMTQASTGDAQGDSLSHNLKTPVLYQALKLRPLLSDKFGLALKQTFKYDTTWDNPETRCYEFKRPITQKYLFLFNFTSKQQYTPTSLP